MPEPPVTLSLPPGRDDLQVILSGQLRHTSAAPATGSGTAISVSSDGSAVVGGDQHLRIYHEYLSYIFRKPEALGAQQQLEMGYRDYLQVSSQ